MRLRTRAVLLGAAFSAIALPVCADPITIVSVSRTIFASASAGEDFRQRQGTGRSFLDETVLARSGDDFAAATAGLESDVRTDAFTADGNTVVTRGSSIDQAGGLARSAFSVEFDVNQIQQFIFTGTFNASGRTGGDRSTWTVQLTNPDGSAAYSLNGSDHRDQFVRGVLQPGRYSFFVNATSSAPLQLGSAETQSGFNIGLGFANPGVSATPEPASMLLLGTGVIGLFARRRLQSHNSQ